MEGGECTCTLLTGTIMMMMIMPRSMNNISSTLYRIFTGNYAEIISASDFKKVVISDSIELPHSALDCPKIAQVRLSSLLANLIASDGIDAKAASYADGVRDG